MNYVVGLMSGTSADGVDAALLQTNGTDVLPVEASCYVPYDAAFRQTLLQAAATGKASDAVVDDLTQYHIQAVKQLLNDANKQANDIEIIGFHGHTIAHAPKKNITQQIGNAAMLRKEAGIAVVSDFRTADVKAGGQGAPLVPIYHQAIAAQKAPCVVVNIGGVSNITYMDEGGALIACDTGPGSALIDDLVHQHTGLPFDKDGEIAVTGTISHEHINTWLQDSFFAQKPPKSLDRNHWSLQLVDDLKFEDAVATLTYFTAKSIAAIEIFLSQKPDTYFITGGGRHNKSMMYMLAEQLEANLLPIEAIGHNGDTLEAAAFGYLAKRTIMNLPITFPTTTGCKQPMTGGVFQPQ